MDELHTLMTEFKEKFERLDVLTVPADVLLQARRVVRGADKVALAIETRVRHAQRLTVVK